MKKSSSTLARSRSGHLYESTLRPRAGALTQSKATRENLKFSRAASRLTPPTDDMLLSAGLRGVSALIQAGKTSPAKLRAKLEAAAAARVVPITMPTRGGGSGISAKLGGILSVFDLLSGLYLPTGAPEWFVPPERRYAFGQSWASPEGLAVASKGSGDLFCVTRARLAGKNDHSEAGVYIRVPTSGSGFGQINRLRLEADIAWSATADAAMEWDWARFAAGNVHVAGKIWLVAYEFNVATNTFDPLPNNAAVNRVLFHQSMSGAGTSPTSASGFIRAGSLALECIVSPARSYLLGVVAQTQVYHNLVHSDGPPHQLRVPTPAEFKTFATLNATVSDMWVSHEVLAR